MSVDAPAPFRIAFDNARDPYTARNALGITINTTAGYQPLDPTLTALAAYNTNGLLTQTAADTFTGRTITGPAAGIIVSNGNGVAGNPTLALANDLAAIEALGGTNTIYYRSGTDAWSAVNVSTGLAFSGGNLTVAPTWTAYTPTITAVSGTFTTVSATGKFITLGKLTHVLMTISITTNGTAAGAIFATLPNTANGAGVFFGRESGVSGKMLQADISGGVKIAIFNYDNTYPGLNGASITMSGTYENT